jgi:hypothetical protein
VKQRSLQTCASAAPFGIFPLALRRSGIDFTPVSPHLLRRAIVPTLIIRPHLNNNHFHLSIACAIQHSTGYK